MNSPYSSLGALGITRVDTWTQPASGLRAYSVFRDAHSVHPSHEELADRLLRNFTGRGIPKAERPECLTVEVMLDPEEAYQGGVHPIGIPIYQPCPECGGTGSESFFPCRTCEPRGYIEEVRTVAINVPARVPPGTVFELPLESFGIRNLFLHVFFSVSR